MPILKTLVNRQKHALVSELAKNEGTSINKWLEDAIDRKISNRYASQTGYTRLEGYSDKINSNDIDQVAVNGWTPNLISRIFGRKNG